MLINILVLILLNIAFHRSDINLRSQSLMIAFEIPQSASKVNINLTHSSAFHVSFPDMIVILLMNLSVMIRVQL